MRKPNYVRMFTSTAVTTWVLLLLYVGWVALKSWPADAFGPLWAESGVVLHVNVVLAAGLIGLCRIGVVAMLRGELCGRRD